MVGNGPLRVRKGTQRCNCAMITRGSLQQQAASASDGLYRPKVAGWCNWLFCRCWWSKVCWTQCQQLSVLHQNPPFVERLLLPAVRTGTQHRFPAVSCAAGCSQSCTEQELRYPPWRDEDLLAQNRNGGVRATDKEQCCSSLPPAVQDTVSSPVPLSANAQADTAQRS